MNHPIDTLCESTKLRLIASALGLQQCTKTAGTLILIPGTEKVIVVGTRAWIAKNVEAAPAGEQPTRHTELAQQLRRIAQSCETGEYIPTRAQMLNAAADEIDRYYGGMLAWKRAAEEKDAAYLAAPTQASTAQADELGQLREEVKRMQDNLETFGPYSQETARVALDGVVDAIDDLVAERAPAIPSQGKADSLNEGVGEEMEGSFYQVAEARGFTDFGLTISGNYSDDKLQALREKYDAQRAGDTGEQA